MHVMFRIIAAARTIAKNYKRKWLQFRTRRSGFQIHIRTAFLIISAEVEMTFNILNRESRTCSRTIQERQLRVPFQKCSHFPVRRQGHFKGTKLIVNNQNFKEVVNKNRSLTIRILTDYLILRKFMCVCKF